LLNFVGVSVSLICIGYFAIKAQHAWQSVDAGFVLSQALPRLVIAFVPTALGYLAATLAWLALMRCLGVPVSALSGSAIYLTAQFGKFLPGNVGHYVGRVVLAARKGYPASTVTLSMTLETLLLLVIAAVLSLPFIGIVAQRLQSAWRDMPTNRLLIVAVMLVVLGGVAAGFALRGWSPRTSVQRWAAQVATAAGSRTALGWLTLSVLFSLATFCTSGLSLLALSAMSFHPHQVIAMVGLYSVAWIVGVLTPGVPAGLGVREAVLVEGLTPVVGAGQAVSTALLFRLLTTLADVITFAIGMVLLRLTPPVATRRP
jgi:uncharacterized membrane protein YbhN (UPF0104 family)